MAPRAQVGTNNHLANSMHECEVYRRMLARVFPIPEGLPVKYVVRSHPHDFGAYREVSVRFCGGDQAASEFAGLVESSVPDCWDPVALQELADLQRQHAQPLGRVLQVRWPSGRRITSIRTACRSDCRSMPGLTNGDRRSRTEPWSREGVHHILCVPLR